MKLEDETHLEIIFDEKRDKIKKTLIDDLKSPKESVPGRFKLTSYLASTDKRYYPQYPLL